MRDRKMEQDKTPLEINDHLKIFGKDADQVDYDSFGLCPFCGSRLYVIQLLCLWWKFGG